MKKIIIRFISGLMLSSLLASPITGLAKAFNAPMLFEAFQADPRPLLQLDEFVWPENYLPSELKSFKKTKLVILTTNIELFKNPDKLKLALSDGKILEVPVIEQSKAINRNGVYAINLNFPEDLYSKLIRKKTNLLVYDRETGQLLAIFKQPLVDEWLAYYWKEKNGRWTKVITHNIKTLTEEGPVLIGTFAVPFENNLWLVNLSTATKPILAGLLLKTKENKVIAATQEIFVLPNQPAQKFTLTAPSITKGKYQLWAVAHSIDGKTPMGELRILTEYPKGSLARLKGYIKNIWETVVGE